MSLKTDTALAIGRSIARNIGVPLSELTKDMVRKAPIPVRFKKLFFGPNTPGETKISPSIKSSRAVAIKEVKALGTGTAMGALGASVTDQILRAVKNKDKEKKKAQPNVRVGIKTGIKKKQKTGTGNKGRNKARTPVNRALDSAKKAVANPPKKKATKPKSRPKKPIPKVRPRVRPGS